MTIYDFVISQPVLSGDSNPPYDRRIEITIVAIISVFLSEKENSVIYICDDSDNRHHIRKRKFDGWFKKNQTGELEI